MLLLAFGRISNEEFLSTDVAPAGSKGRELIVRLLLAAKVGCVTICGVEEKFYAESDFKEHAYGAIMAFAGLGLLLVKPIYSKRASWSKMFISNSFRLFKILYKIFV